VLTLDVIDADIGGRWFAVIGKGQRERRVPLDPDVASVIQVYLLAEWPESASGRQDRQEFVDRHGDCERSALATGGGAVLPP